MTRRVTQRQIPDSPCSCRITWACPYREEGVCSMPRTFKGNSDAACHGVTPKYLLWQIDLIKQINGGEK